MRQELPDRDEIADLPPDGGPDFNRLIFESSPYLLQHARNPVDWWPWCDEAFESAREQDLPVFLSVGYSTCHWCHVMERESFESERIARLLNEGFVPIKVDREERPDVDEIYMTATQLMTGHSGWPNSVWLTPDRRPWYAGTYFPPESRGGMPGFDDLLERLAGAWKTERNEVEGRGIQLQDAIRGSTTLRDAAPVPLTRALLRGATEALADRFDSRYGGFGDQPKFPPHTALRLLLYQHQVTGEERALEMAVETLNAMARGGLHDHVGGGFHRYCTDAWWLVPHFEKMLYDNGQLSRSYAIAYEVTGAREYEIAARGICDWALREMLDEAGGFYSALDADSEGEEGKFYLWDRDEVIDAVGGEAALLLCEIFNVREDGNFTDEVTGRRSERNILHVSDEGLMDEELWPFVQQAKQSLLEVRAERIRPHRDEKVLAAWNGLMIGGLAVAGRVFDEPAYTEAASRAAKFVLTEMRRDGRLMRGWRDGALTGPGYLDDYAFMAEGLLDLHESTGDRRRLDEASELAEEMLRLFGDSRGGGLFFTAEEDEELLARMKRPFDQSTPSGNGVAARALVRLAGATGQANWLETSEDLLETFSAAMQNAPTSTEALLTATGHFLDMQERLTDTEETRRDAEEAPDARAQRGPITVTAWASRRRARPGDQIEVAIRVQIEDGWHVNAHEPLQENLVGTEVQPGDGSGCYRLDGVDYPDAEQLQPEFADEALAVYVGEVWLRARISVNPDADSGHEALQMSLVAQPCDDRACGRPERHILELPLEVDPDASDEPRHGAVFERFA